MLRQTSATPTHHPHSNDQDSLHTSCASPIFLIITCLPPPALLLPPVSILCLSISPITIHDSRFTMHPHSRPILPSHGRREGSFPPPLLPPSPFALPSPRRHLHSDYVLQSRRHCGDIRLHDPSLMYDPFQQPRQPYSNQGYMPNGAPVSGPVPGATPLLPNQGRILQQGPIRVLCIADVRGRTSTLPAYCIYMLHKANGDLVGNLSSLNDLARQARADHIIHTGDFGFYDETSLDRIAEK